MDASTKLILLVREPVSRAISDYTQLRTGSTDASIKERNHIFEELVLLPNGSVNLDYPPITISIYNNYIESWLEHFPRRQILIIDGDQLIENPLPQVKIAEKFLGVEPKILKSNFYFNRTKGFYCFRDDTNDWCLNETKGRKHSVVDPSVVSTLRKFFSEHNKKFYEAAGIDFGWPSN